MGKENYDDNRLEQEMIYYIEKIDISEEQVRLKNHCDYFKAIMCESRKNSKGKSYSFILQEIGREINTTGAKAYDAAIQKCVVLMKDELGKGKRTNSQCTLNCRATYFCNDDLIHRMKVLIFLAACSIWLTTCTTIDVLREKW